MQNSSIPCSLFGFICVHLRNHNLIQQVYTPHTCLSNIDAMGLTPLDLPVHAYTCSCAMLPSLRCLILPFTFYLKRLPHPISMKQQKATEIIHSPTRIQNIVCLCRTENMAIVMRPLLSHQVLSSTASSHTPSENKPFRFLSTPSLHSLPETCACPPKMNR